MAIETRITLHYTALLQITRITTLYYKTIDYNIILYDNRLQDYAVLLQVTRLCYIMSDNKITLHHIPLHHQTHYSSLHYKITIHYNRLQAGLTYSVVSVVIIIFFFVRKVNQRQFAFRKKLKPNVCDALHELIEFCTVYKSSSLEVNH